MDDELTIHAGVFQCAPELFAGLLQLPAGSYVDAVWIDPDRPGTVNFRVRGPAWPKCRIGAHIPFVTGEFKQTTYPGGMVAYSAEWK
jgi:hypothetical protein